MKQVVQITEEGRVYSKTRGARVFILKSLKSSYISGTGAVNRALILFWFDGFRVLKA